MSESHLYEEALAFIVNILPAKPDDIFCSSNIYLKIFYFFKTFYRFLVSNICKEKMGGKINGAKIRNNNNNNFNYLANF